VRSLIEQLDRSLGSGLYYLTLFGTLAIPDIGGALDSDNGEASGAKYVQWYETWVRPRFMETVLASVPESARPHIRNIANPLSGDACYRFRCSMLHQGTGATTNVVHYGRMNDALCIDLNLFCREMISGTVLWLKQVETTPRFIGNYERFVRRYPNGLAPYIVGVPVVS
jgi:hypothetical protein